MNTIYILGKIIMALFWEPFWLVENVGVLFGNPKNFVSQIAIFLAGAGAGYFSYISYTPHSTISTALVIFAHTMGMAVFTIAIILQWFEDNNWVHLFLAIMAGMAIGPIIAAYAP